MSYEPFCLKCGSPNHQSLDCQNPNPNYVPPPPPPEPEAPPKDKCPRCGAEMRQGICQNYGCETPVARGVQEIFEPTLRWPGAPKICTATNLPAFETEKDMDQFSKRFGPGVKEVKRFQCETCHCWHHETTEAAPSGGSSGNSRESELPMGFKPFLREETKESIKSFRDRRQDAGELPKQVKPPPAAKSPRIPKQTDSSNLF